MSLVQTGQCEVYARIEDFSNVSGDAVHYMEIQLSVVPQVNVIGHFIHDRTVREYFVNRRAGVFLPKGLQISVSIPTIGLDEVTFTVPDQDSHNIAELLE